MLKLRSTGSEWISPVDLPRRLILRVTTNADMPAALRSQYALVVENINQTPPKAFALTLVRSTANFAGASGLVGGVIALDPDLHYLGDGDVIRIAPNLKISVLYRKNANAHSVLLTERCNSFCVMCSQPPRDIDDSYIVADVLEAIPLFDRGAKEIGFTGGEPTRIWVHLLVSVRKAC